MGKIINFNIRFLASRYYTSRTDPRGPSVQVALGWQLSFVLLFPPLYELFSHLQNLHIVGVVSAYQVTQLTNHSRNSLTRSVKSAFK